MPAERAPHPPITFPSAPAAPVDVPRPPRVAVPRSPGTPAPGDRLVDIRWVRAASCGQLLPSLPQPVDQLQRC